MLVLRRPQIPPFWAGGLDASFVRARPAGLINAIVERTLFLDILTADEILHAFQ
jgi:hypothetical protein